jgi:hypothetical protein
MKDIFTTIGRILGLAFAALVIGYTAWLTWLLAQRLIPDNIILQFMTIALFDGGAITWFVMFITQAKATLQWAIAGIGFLVGLVGAIIMAAGELIMGQSLVILDDPTKLGWILVTTVVVAAAFHATLIYLFHFSDPATRNRIENAQEVSKSIEQAYRDARAEISRNSDVLTARLKESVLHEATQQIASSTAYHIRNAGKLTEKTGEILRGGEVIDGKLKETPVTRMPERVFVKDVIRLDGSDNGNSPNASRGK